MLDYKNIIIKRYALGLIVNVIDLFTMQKTTVKQVSHLALRKSRSNRQGQPLILAVPTNNGYAFSRAS